MFQYSIMLIGGTKIDIAEKELRDVQYQIKSKNPCIIVGKRSFAYHQFSMILPIKEAEFLEKMRLREKGFYRCRTYQVIHKYGDHCDCKDTGEINPFLLSDDGVNPLLAGADKSS